MQTLIDIFSAPTKAFESLDQKPTWLLPFIISIVAVVATQYFTLDAQLDYRIATMEARDVPQAQIDAARQGMSGGMKYIGMIVGPIFVPIMWAILAALLLGFSKITIPDGINFKKSFSIIAWSGLVTLVEAILISFLIFSKGTVHGVALDLSALLTTPPIGAETPVINRLFAKIDPFVIWQLILWVIALKVMGKTTFNKAAVPVVILWILWIVLSVSLGGFFESLSM